MQYNILILSKNYAYIDIMKISVEYWYLMSNTGI